MQNIPLRDSVIKEVMDRGHSGGIYLPKAWIGQRVVVQPLSVKDYVIGALSPYLEDVSGVFLYGSYAVARSPTHRMSTSWWSRRKSSRSRGWG